MDPLQPTMPTKKVTIAPGDGIGPEITDFVLDVFHAAEVPLTYERVAMGRAAESPETPDGLSHEAIASIGRTGVLLKGPVETPEADGVPRADAAARRRFGAYAEKRIYRMLPGVPTPIGQHDLGLTIVRGMVEEGYETVEQMVDRDVAQAHRFSTRSGAERLHRYSFEMASKKGARRITCAHQADVMRLTDGMFVEVFYQIAREYPHLRADDLTVDRLARHLLVDPDAFDVVVLTDMPGNIVPELAAGLVGGLEYAPSASIGESVGIFEPVHGTARDLVGQDQANPTAFLLAGSMMLRHVDLVDHATRIESAVERALYRMNRDAGVREHVRRFHTSVFRHLVLTELRREQEAVATPPASERGSSVATPIESSGAPRSAGLALPSLTGQLQGLA